MIYREKESGHEGHYLSNLPTPLSTPFRLKEKTWSAFLIPSPHVYGGENCSLSFFLPFFPSAPPFLSLFSRARPPRIPRVNHHQGDFVNLQPPRVSARWPFTGEGQPDYEECLKVGDLYGLRAILFRERWGWLVFRTADRGETRNIN